TTAPGADGSHVKGKFPYLAPELLKETDPNPGTDVYSLVLCLHELLAGRNEMRAKDIETTLKRVTQHVPTRLDALRTDVPAALADIVARGLSKSPSERYGSAQSLLLALRDMLHEQGAPHEELGRAAAADFEAAAAADPAFGLPDLAALDRAWRTAAVSIPPGPHQRRIDRSEEPTRQAPRTVPPAASTNRRLILAAVGLSALSLGVAAMVVVRTPSTPPQQAYVYVQSTPGTDPSEGDAQVAAVARPDASTPVAAAADAAVGSAPAVIAAPGAAEPAHAPPDSATVLSRRFAHEQGRVRQCASANAAELPESGGVAIRFEIDTHGSVTATGLVPAEMEGSHLGACLLGIARSVNFGRQDSRVAFRIPVRLRRVGGEP
ncbi:MAG: hypothetical protein WCJ30_15040, partial [Deltaproteobacteria bacterium]